MRQVVLPGTDLRVSRFSFGTASLFNAGSAAGRARLLAAAWDSGFTHFDTAPYYGFGVAERDLGLFLATRPDATVTTKVGLHPPGGADQPASHVFLRKAAGKLVPSLSRPLVDWSVARARESLSGSLRRLRRERVDLFLLHEPDRHLLDADEWLRWLESERDRVAWFGIAPGHARLMAFIEPPHPVANVIQAMDSIDGREADLILRAGRKLQMTYGYVSAARPPTAAAAGEILRLALRRNDTGSVIVSTRKTDRLPQFAAIADGPDDAVEPAPARRAPVPG
jgi:aryl-alcohol dehydrogenase-like predicted oxidoreductase